MESMKVYKECLSFKNRTGRWPRAKIKINNIRVSRKEITDRFNKGLIEKKLYDELVEEFSLFYRWKACQERKILVQYVGVPIDKIPKKYQKMIDTLRGFGLGYPGGKIDVVERFESFYKKYGRTPEWVSGEREKLSEDELIERRLYELWIISDANKLTKKYIDTPLEEIPEEDQDTIRRLRAIGVGADGKKLTATEEYMAFVRAFAREPIHYLNPIGDDQIKEHGIKQRWRGCNTRILFDKYKGVLLEEIPEEDRQVVAELRQMWLEVDGAHVMEEVFNFLDKHKREPRSFNQGQSTFGRVLSEDEMKEADLAARWNRCFEKQVMDRFYQRKYIPKKYKEIIEILRDHDLAYPESYNTRMFMKFVRNTGSIPRQVIVRNGERISHKKYNENEQYETSVRIRFDGSEDRKIYEAYKAGKLGKRMSQIYADMIQILDEIYQIDANSRAELSVRRKIEYKERIKKQNAKNKEEKRKAGIETAEPEVIQEEPRDEISEEMKKELRKKKRNIEIAERYIAFIKKYRKLPHLNIKRNGVDIKVADLTAEEAEERDLYRAWNKCNFMETIEIYAGVPIEHVPEEYRKVISEFRSEGFGLTSDEYFKFRSTRPSQEILFSIKARRDMSASKRAKAIELEEEILKELRKIEKEQDDE